jgi:predicted esterase
MGGSESASREPCVKYGYYRTYLGEDVWLQPIVDEKGTVMNPVQSLIIFLHDNSENPQKYMGHFMNKLKERVVPWDKQPHVLLVEAPTVVKTEKDGLKTAIWCGQNEDPMGSPAMQMLQGKLNEQIGMMGGRADRVVLAGVGTGGHMALLAGFLCPHVLGGVVAIDTDIPASLYGPISTNEGAALFPNLEQKMNMHIGLCPNTIEDENKIKAIGQQCQMFRGKGFLRLSTDKIKKQFERSLGQFHCYPKLGGDEFAKAELRYKARAGDLDDKAAKAIGCK